MLEFHGAFVSGMMAVMLVLLGAVAWVWRVDDPHRKLAWLRRLAVAFAVCFTIASVAVGGVLMLFIVGPITAFAVWSELKSYATCPKCGQFLRDRSSSFGPRKCKNCGWPLVVNYHENPAGMMRLTLDAMRHFEDVGRIGETKIIPPYIRESTGIRVSRASVGLALEELERRGQLVWQRDHWRVVSPQTRTDGA